MILVESIFNVVKSNLILSFFWSEYWKIPTRKNTQFAHFTQGKYRPEKILNLHTLRMENTDQKKHSICTLYAWKIPTRKNTQFAHFTHGKYRPEKTLNLHTLRMENTDQKKYSICTLSAGLWLVIMTPSKGFYVHAISNIENVK